MKTEDPGTPRSNRIGLSAIALNWIAAAISVPFAKLIGARVTAEELLLWRSFGCIVVALMFISVRRARHVPREVKTAGFIIGFSSICFYEALKAWNVGSVSVLLCFTPIVNIAMAITQGQRIQTRTIVGLCAIIVGTAIALEFWNNPPSVLGLFWMLLCIVVSAVGFDMWGRLSDTVTVSEKAFWLSIWCGLQSALVWGVLLIAGVVIADLPKYTDAHMIFGVAMYTVTVTAYIFLSIIPFSLLGRMSTTKTVILLQAGTPATILGAVFILHDRFSFLQCCGIALTLAGATYVSLRGNPSLPAPVPSLQAPPSG